MTISTSMVAGLFLFLVTTSASRAEHGHAPSHCIVGEPSCTEAIGDTIRIGRRGSLSAKLVVTGKQGHVGYAHLANNPVMGFVRIAAALKAEPLDRGTEHFVPSNLEIVSADVGNPVYNVIPARIEAKMNVRYNDLHSAKSLEAWTRAKAESSVMPWWVTFLMTRPFCGS